MRPLKSINTTVHLSLTALLERPINCPDHDRHEARQPLLIAARKALQPRLQRGTPLISFLLTRRLFESSFFSCGLPSDATHDLGLTVSPHCLSQHTPTQPLANA
jgi:hypothetical protein